MHLAQPPFLFKSVFFIAAAIQGSGLHPDFQPFFVAAVLGFEAVWRLGKSGFPLLWI